MIHRRAQHKGVARLPRACLPVCVDGVNAQVAVPLEHEDLVGRGDVRPGPQLSSAAFLHTSEGVSAPHTQQMKEELLMAQVWSSYASFTQESIVTMLAAPNNMSWRPL